ncbi:S-formylglutathione hydrolase [Anoplophora glabripennis]|nr:S-formylglutathione hydrolase [Anoplophora glabripennis]XP_018564295.1 S-formylglutathione hydrolase [Anoplophora glabripennis]XP_018564296.1 S-formylglutathione hydrolase [Anoplophora glabripennis]
MALKEVSSNKSFGGWQKVYSHNSTELGCSMKFGIYLPPQAEEKKLPVIYWLSGLTCTEANFIEKAGAQRYAAEHGVIIVNPDTSPRDLNILGDSDAYDFGVGAGFYINATQDPWKKNYRMYNYVTIELPSIINSNFGISENKQSIMGHSMGGHGALICALKNPGLYKSVSAFAPICNPSECPWGIKAFTGYLGPRETSFWSDWDATELVKKYNGPPIELLIDQGLEDNFLSQKQLLPENLIEACKAVGVPAILKKREGYNHSYFYIASFIGEHIKYHAEALLK